MYINDSTIFSLRLEDVDSVVASTARDRLKKPDECLFTFDSNNLQSHFCVVFNASYFL